MSSIDRSNLITELKKLNLTNGFPYEDINLIQENYNNFLPGLKEENQLIEDFNEFQLLIAGSGTYAIKGRKIPSFQKKYLANSFFERYPYYSFLEGELGKYPDFKEELEVFEAAREILWKV
ncbi:YxiJ-like family protein [Planococcus ruber]|uniref:YxiJ-like family protein n=1 Tax=Planococcus ruber TaxID=2027871 RepID=UPI001FEF8CD9|nr:YxiJ-like family protein [Planococcus ruber]MCJ1908990.1 YxiJ-like family protein [Planococcus ruber]